jgi:hypothetical protein
MSLDTARGSPSATCHASSTNVGLMNSTAAVVTANRDFAGHIAPRLNHIHQPMGGSDECFLAYR